MALIKHRPDDKIKLTLYTIPAFTLAMDFISNMKFNQQMCTSRVTGCYFLSGLILEIVALYSKKLYDLKQQDNKEEYEKLLKYVANIIA